MHLAIVDETRSCRLLIQLDDGPRCEVLVTLFFQRIDPMLLHKIFQTPFFFSDNNDNIKTKTTTTTTQKRQKLTHMQIVVVAVEYLDYSCRNEKRSIRNFSFYVSSNIFASFLSQTSKIVHSSLHLSTCSARFTSCDFICVVCRLPFERSVRFILVLRR